MNVVIHDYREIQKYFGSVRGRWPGIIVVERFPSSFATDSDLSKNLEALLIDFGLSKDIYLNELSWISYFMGTEDIIIINETLLKGIDDRDRQTFELHKFLNQKEFNLPDQIKKQLIPANSIFKSPRITFQGKKGQRYTITNSMLGVELLKITLKFLNEILPFANGKQKRLFPGKGKKVKFLDSYKKEWGRAIFKYCRERINMKTECSYDFTGRLMHILGFPFYHNDKTLVNPSEEGETDFRKNVRSFLRAR